jgi:hypothetical protein
LREINFFSRQGAKTQRNPSGSGAEFLFMNKSRLQKGFLFGITLLLSIFCVIGASWILPKNCSLFESRSNGFRCDGIDVANPKPCPVCEDESILSVAEILFCLGFGFLLLPLVIYGFVAWQNRSAVQSKLLN